MRRAQPAVVADVLTVSRLGLAVLVIPSAWTRNLTLTSALLAAAWLTDFLDGRIARAAGVTGRMGPWDLTVDTTVGVGLIIGLTGAGEVPALFGVAAILVLGSWSLAGNFAAALLLQLAGYLPLLDIVWRRRPPVWWLPFLTVIVIGLMDWRRLVTVNIPRFIRGLTGWFVDYTPRDRKPDDTPA
jgi:hypothetical protein